jgi:protein-S-isoprenylcysteine O-methyltransferase Ste14
VFRRLNDLPVFDPSRWPARETVARVLGCVTIGSFWIRRFLMLPSWPGYIRDVDWARPYFAKLAFLPEFLLARPVDLEGRYAYFGYTVQQVRILWSLELLVWVTEMAILSAYIAGFLTRAGAKSVARGFMQSVFPLLVAGLPFAIVLTRTSYPQWVPEYSSPHLQGLYAIQVVLIAAGALNVAGLIALRKAFAVMSEARVFVREGVYSVIRHPLYLAQFGIYLCCTLLHLQLWTLTVYVAFVAGQTLRARIEERKLASVFPEYEGYRRATGMFFPKVWGGEPGIGNP